MAARVKPKKIGKLNIFGQSWTIYHGPLSPHHAGLCEYDKLRLTVSDEIKIGSNLFKETLFHELLHSTFERCSYKQSGLPHELEEVMIDQIAKILTENLDTLWEILKPKNEIKKAK
jgi:hypothetical protein